MSGPGYDSRVSARKERFTDDRNNNGPSGVIMWDFIKFIFWLLVFFGGVLVFFAYKGYNGLRAHAESIREAWSNIGVSAKKQVSLIKQLIDVVKGYQESEKLVMLKVSDDMSSAAAVAQMHQQAGLVMASVAGMAQRFPELKANDQYQRLISSIQECESALERSRQHYNSTVKAYNTLRSSIPNVFYAATLGFKTAPYLEFDGNNMQTEIGTLATFSADDDGERLNQMLGAAGSSAKRLGGRALSGGVQLANKAIEGGKVLAESAKVAVDGMKEARATGVQPEAPDSATLPSALPPSLSAEPALAPDETRPAKH